jgi:AcrR family transcriptional regulator
VTVTQPAQGRPRDPDVDRKIAQAALDVFGETGWSGFSMEAVARRAGVGKASVYLRWSSKESLLADVIRQISGVADTDTGTLRGDLTELAIQMLGLYTGPGGLASLRLSLEGERIPGLAEQFNAMKRATILAARAVVGRAIERGELPPDAPATLLLETLTGATLMHVLATPPDRRADLSPGIRTHAEQLVGFLLRAVTP